MPLLSDGRFSPRAFLLKQAVRFVEASHTELLPGRSTDEGQGGFICARNGCGRVPRRGDVPMPLYEGKPICSLACMAAMIEADVFRQTQQRDINTDPYHHRMPIGLLMLSRKWITRHQLSAALQVQRSQGFGRLGEWLLAAGAADETKVAQAFATQWGIPVVEQEQIPEAARTLPQLLTDAFGLIPLRIAAGRILYTAIDRQMDPGVQQSLEKMTGLRIEPVAMPLTHFRRLQQAGAGSPARLLRTSSAANLRDAVIAMIREKNTANVWLTRLCEYYWLRLQRKDRGEDGDRVFEDAVFILDAPQKVLEK